MIRVLFFASLREAVGRDGYELPLESAPGGALGLEGLMAELKSRLAPGAYAALVAENVRIAVNQVMVDGAVTLQPGDEVAFLPPVTGG